MTSETNLKEKFLGWIRHYEYHELKSVYPSGEPYMVYRGLKSIYHVIAEITHNQGYPAKGAVWITSSYEYAARFGPAYILHIDPERLGSTHPASFIPDKPDTFTTGKPINLYAMMFPRARKNLFDYLLAHYPELAEYKGLILDVLQLNPEEII